MGSQYAPSTWGTCILLLAVDDPGRHARCEVCTARRAIGNQGERRLKVGDQGLPSARQQERAREEEWVLVMLDSLEGLVSTGSQVAQCQIDGFCGERASEERPTDTHTTSIKGDGRCAGSMSGSGRCQGGIATGRKSGKMGAKWLRVEDARLA